MKNNNPKGLLPIANARPVDSNECTPAFDTLLLENINARQANLSARIHIFYFSHLLKNHLTVRALFAELIF